MSSLQNPRAAAYKILFEVWQNGAYPNIALKDMMPKGLSGADRRLVTTIVYGCIKNSIYLDYIIGKFSSVKLKKLSPSVLIILRMGLYQIFMLDRVPDRAAVDESVKLAAKNAYKSKSFINAVLRSAARDKDKIELPKDKEEYLSVKYSFCEELVRELLDLYKDEAEEIMCALNSTPEITARVNTLLCTADEAAESINAGGGCAEKSAHEDAIILKNTDVSSLVEYKTGKIICQGIGSMYAARALGVRPGMTVMDMCAAPGGKSTYIAQMMHNKGKVFSFDIYPHKAELIRKNAERMGLSIIECAVCDSAQYMEKFYQKADAVLVDAPCSGVGIASKKPDIKLSYTRQKSEELSKIQFEILKTSAKYVKRGGVLVYSTCTIIKRENEDVCRLFLDENPEFELCEPDYLWEGADKKSPFVTLLPGKDGCDGFFICKMRRKDV